jgi:hypothetical protein
MNWLAGAALMMALVVPAVNAVTQAAEAQLKGSEVEAIRKMNENYFRSWRENDIAWYQENLANEFVCTVGSGAVIDKQQFLAPSDNSDIADAHIEDIVIRVYPSGTAVVTANTVYTNKQGTTGATRYTDVYAKIDGRWKVVCAQLTPDKNFKAPVR